MRSYKGTIDDEGGMMKTSQSGAAVSGILDWGDCGLGDGRYDLWACIWSIKFNARLCGLDDSPGQALADAFWEEFHSGPQGSARSDHYREQEDKDLQVWGALYKAFDYVYLDPET